MLSTYKIFYVYTSFKSYSPKTGFNQAIVSKGFCEDKIGVIGLNIPLLIIESILFISLLAFIEEKIFRLRKRGAKISLKEIFTVLKDKIIYTTICFAIPSILSFVMIWSISFIMPEGPDHFMETISVLWVLLLTICMSIIPTALNLFVVNRLQIDGFHNYRGYRTFANASIYATYLPLFVLRQSYCP